MAPDGSGVSRKVDRARDRSAQRFHSEIVLTAAICDGAEAMSRYPKDEPDPNLVEYALKLMVQATRAPTGIAEVDMGRSEESRPER